MREKILNDIKEAMKSKDKELLNVLRMVKGAAQLEEINKKRELNDEEMTAIVSKQIKTRKETISDLEKANRPDLIEQNNLEISILSKYMPEMMSEEEITRIVKEVISNVNPNPNEIGKVMGQVTPLVKGKADMSLVNKIVRDNLN